MLKIYSVSDDYVNFLRADPRLHNVVDNKEDIRVHTRKYLGAVFENNGFFYYIPFYSPKKSDYFDAARTNIRPSVIPIIRMVAKDVNNKPELKGTLKISNMIPVPEQELIPYNISEEQDASYKTLIIKEYSFIAKNTELILKNAKLLYSQKVNEDTYFPPDKKRPGYLKDVVDFKYAEQKCLEYIQQKGLQQSNKPSLQQKIQEITRKPPER